MWLSSVFWLERTLPGSPMRAVWRKCAGDAACGRWESPPSLGEGENLVIPSEKSTSMSRTDTKVVHEVGTLPEVRRLKLMRVQVRPRAERCHYRRSCTCWRRACYSPAWWSWFQRGMSLRSWRSTWARCRGTKCVHEHFTLFLCYETRS